jgi:hypothetical protein
MSITKETILSTLSVIFALVLVIGFRKQPWFAAALSSGLGTSSLLLRKNKAMVVGGILMLIGAMIFWILFLQKSVEVTSKAEDLAKTAAVTSPSAPSPGDHPVAPGDKRPVLAAPEDRKPILFGGQPMPDVGVPNAFEATGLTQEETDKLHGLYREQEEDLRELDRKEQEGLISTEEHERLSSALKQATDQEIDAILGDRKEAFRLASIRYGQSLLQQHEPELSKTGFITPSVE